ncbi:LacI family DNA-binding transcriptional regulator [Paenibacillus thermoaerophilus]|uniref:LacI family DNA-binding transcriptional regulator n=1 Tax=Paenibacillus thermoaerophilus TaxID=1215385 RepID=A0ABW2UYA9_9BACL|nr:LacI family DNA-binding transcriptional regulator [Paenibacillus thermoaerophilus]TMV17791.1 LacI family transcriptional regulator [Paenibacillus thermoaerophilus]
MSKPKSITIVDVAREAGVSTATVSNVLNRRNVPLSEDIIRRVEAAADRLGYRRNAMAASLSRQRTNELGLLLPSFGGYFGGFAEACEREAHERGYHLSVFSGSNDPELERRHLDRLLQRRVDGLICHGLAMSPEATREIVRDGTPMVLFNAWSWPEDIAVGTVNLDFKSGVEEAVHRLYERGCRSIFYVGQHKPNTSDPPRYEGFLQGIAGLPGPVTHAYVRADASDFRVTVGRLLQLAGDSRPFGIICFDDLLAFAMMYAGIASGLRVPEQMMVVGMNNHYMTRYSHPTITSMDIPYKDQAELTVRWLISAIDDKPDEWVLERSGGRSRVDIPVKLLMRGSTGDS